MKGKTINKRVVVEKTIIDSFMSDWDTPPSFFAKWFYHRPYQFLWRARVAMRNTKQKLTTGFPHHEAYEFPAWFAKAALPRLRFLKIKHIEFEGIELEGDHEPTQVTFDKIIWSLEHYDDYIQPTPPEDYNPQCVVTKYSDGSTEYTPIDKRPYDYTPCKEHTKKVQDGLDLFAKHFYDLWL